VLVKIDFSGSCDGWPTRNLHFPGRPFLFAAPFQKIPGIARLVFDMLYFSNVVLIIYTPRISGGGHIIKSDHHILFQLMSFVRLSHSFQRACQEVRNQSEYPDVPNGKEKSGNDGR
jgi:hypothetical protein